MLARYSSWSLALLFIGGISREAVPQAAPAAAPPRIEPQRFEKDIQAFEASDKLSPPPTGAIVVTGSSSVRRWHPTIQRDLAPLTIVPRGFGGSTMEDALYWIDRVAIAYEPRAIVVYEGDNDTGRYQVPPATIARPVGGSALADGASARPNNTRPLDDEAQISVGVLAWIHG